MESNLKMNAKLTQLLKNVAQQRGITLSALKEEIDENEILDRFTAYPKLSVILLPDNIDIDSLRVIANDLLVFARWDKSQFKAFLKNTDFAKNAIHSLIKDFPKDDSSAAKRIDAFIENLITSDLSEGKDGLKESHVALFCSLFLTVAFPERFVDFRQTRWTNLAKMIGYKFPDKGDSYGQMMIWAGKFAKEIAETPIFQKFWDVEHPLWAVAGLCWNLKDEKIVVSNVNNGEDPMPNEYQKIKELLQNKKQIIIYGPPGTGKTYHAKKFISEYSTEDYRISDKSLIDQTVYILIAYGPRDGNIPKMKIGDRFRYEWTGNRNWQKYFDDLQEGDIALVYFQADHRLTSIVRCIQKEKESITFEIKLHFPGPTYSDLHKDPVLGDTAIGRATMSFSLRALSEIELERLIKITPDLSYEVLGITIDKSDIPVKNQKFVTFHPSFGYEDFIEGLRPYPKDDGTVGYRIEEGIFKEFSRQAFNVLCTEAGIECEWNNNADIPELDPEDKQKLRELVPKYPFYLIIDEINRGDISRIFGELITLIECDKRYTEPNEMPTVLPYSKLTFAIPPNLYIIGTMNTADRSIALLDIALRRRFGFIEMMPQPEIIIGIVKTKDTKIQEIVDIAISLLASINEKIIGNYDRDHQIGHSYFVKLNEANTPDAAIKILHFIWYHEIMPLLQEYYYDSPLKLQEIIGNDFITVTNHDRSFLFKEELTSVEFLVAIRKLAQKGSVTSPLMINE